MKITLETLVGKDMLGGDVPHDMSMVFVEHEALYKVNPKCRIHVGYIGTQAGANFCPLPAFTEHLGPANRDAVIAEVKRQHGAASPEPPVELPPAMEVEVVDGT